jgi:hypothetical protein
MRQAFTEDEIAAAISLCILKMETAGVFENTGNLLKTPGLYYSENKSKNFHRHEQHQQSRVVLLMSY